MDLKEKIISATIATGISKKNDKPFTAIDILFKAADGTVIRKRAFLLDYEKPLLGIE